MFKVNYSILSYYPDIYLHSNLAVGVSFEIIGESYHKNEIKFITQRRKISSFDDEIDNLVLINMFLDGLKCEFEQTNQSIKNYKKKLVKSRLLCKMLYNVFTISTYQN
ncbi:hypothetical protein [Staphylococcus aureus]|uniref:hypothetical protein n=1 Tax=Staphylococcus aureus TaxID=1280 RepID=UPI002269D7CE|nr:hypothetical protein [Staphylococcus aureus]WAA05748.1 hypothetical protein M1F51_06805 [Staphylococcus aureus]